MHNGAELPRQNLALPFSTHQFSGRVNEFHARQCRNSFKEIFEQSIDAATRRNIVKACCQHPSVPCLVTHMLASVVFRAEETGKVLI